MTTLDEKAQSLVNHLRKLDDFRIVDSMDGVYGHMGATITDAILQAGTKYDTVVRPRVQKIRELYPETITTSDFLHLIDKTGIKQLLSWQDDEKPNRVIGITNFAANFKPLFGVSLEVNVGANDAVKRFLMYRCHMWVIQNLSIRCHKGTIINSRRCNDYLVSRITMKFAGQLSGFDSNFWRQSK